MINKKEPIIVPRGIRFISDWKEFNFKRFPTKCILNKQLPGCGFTEYCIKGPENVILCSPRKMLLQNKKDQHGEEVYLVVNEYEPELNIDKNLDKDKPVFPNMIKPNDDTKDLENRKKVAYLQIKDKLQEYIGSRGGIKPLKILVTYDSYRIVQGILKELNIFQYFYTVVDEFQTILHDSRFKSDTELDFLHYLNQSHSALFVSATPTLDEYLEMLDEFEGLDYIELDWGSNDPQRVKKPDLKVLSMKSVGTKIKDILNTYRLGKFETVMTNNSGKLVEVTSKEAVFYVNSVSHIISIIKSAKLLPDEVNILCSNTDTNRARIKKKLGKKFEIGSVPLKGETNKMFTFCTRTVYLGADFYSKCARSFVFSDSNIESLAVDISEDLPQILGRQRDVDNPWKNQATFYYKTTHDYRKIKWEDFEKILKEKRKITNDLLEVFKDACPDRRDSLAKKYESDARNSAYKSDYVAVNTKDGYTPVFNNLVYVNELRSFKIQQVDYKDRFTVFSTIQSENLYSEISEEVMEFSQKFESITTFRGKLKFLCESDLSSSDKITFVNQLDESNKIRSYFITIGPKRLSALSYKKNLIELEYRKLLIEGDVALDTEIITNFTISQKLGLVESKDIVAAVYNKVNYLSSPKASDLGKWFKLKKVTLNKTLEDGTKKRVNGFELVSVKPEYQNLYDELHPAKNKE